MDYCVNAPEGFVSISTRFMIVTEKAGSICVNAPEGFVSISTAIVETKEDYRDMC